MDQEIKLAHLWSLEGIGKLKAPYFIATPTSTEMLHQQMRFNFWNILQNASKAFQNQAFGDAQKHIQAGRSIPGYEQDSRLMDLWFELYKICKPGELRHRWIEKHFELHENEVYGCAISPDGKTGLSASWDEAVRMWDLDTGHCLKIFKGHVNEINAVKYTVDGRFCLSCGGDETLRLWDLESGECLKIFRGHSDLVSCLDISSDGRLIISGDWKGEARLWDISTGVCLRTYVDLLGFVSSVAFTPDGMGVIFGCGTNEDDEHTLQYWDISNGNPIHTFNNFTDSIWSIAVSPDGKEVLAGTGFGKIYRFDLETGDCLEVWEGPVAEVSAICFSPNGRYAFSGASEGKLWVWDMESGNCVHTSTTHKSSINCIAVSLTGGRILTGSSDLTLQLWALEWELEAYQPAQWDEGALPYLEIFLKLHTPYAGQIPQGRKPTEDEIRYFLTHIGKPSWTEEDFQSLLVELGHRGYGWLQPDGVRHKLEELAGKKG